MHDFRGLKVMVIHNQHHANVSKQTLLLACVDVAPPNGVVQRRSHEPRHEKTKVLVSDLVQHKPGCTAREDG